MIFFEFFVYPGTHFVFPIRILNRCTVQLLILGNLLAGLSLTWPIWIVAQNLDIEEVTVDENKFRWEMNEDAMATEKLAEGIRKFGVDAVKLENVLREKLV